MPSSRAPWVQESVAGDEYLRNMASARLLRGRIGPLGRGLLLCGALGRRARLLGRVFRPSQDPGCPRPEPLPGSVGRGSVGLRFLRLHRPPGGAG